MSLLNNVIRITLFHTRPQTTMDQNLISHIESLDHTPESDELLDNIYQIIKSRIEDPTFDQQICDIVFEMYCRLCRERSLSDSCLWWESNFSLYKNIRQDIADRRIETELNDLERLSNLHLIDSILFYIKLMTLQLRLKDQRSTNDNLGN